MTAPSLFPEPDLVSAEEVDREWLQRCELRSLEDVANYLDGTAFRQLPGCLAALYVDNRCGLIRSELMRLALRRDPLEVASQILRQASFAQAHGIMLASFDPTGNLFRSTASSTMTKELSRKAEATGVSLLSHLVLTQKGWIKADPQKPKLAVISSTQQSNDRPISEGIRRASRQRPRTVRHSGSHGPATPPHRRGSSRG